MTWMITQSNRCNHIFSVNYRKTAAIFGARRQPRYKQLPTYGFLPFSPFSYLSSAPLQASPPHLPLPMRSLPFLSLPFLCTALVVADSDYKIYQPKNQVIYGGTALHLTATTTAATSNFTNAAAYDQTVLNAPAVPNPAIPTSVPIQLQSSGVSSNVSVPVNGGFFGISVEMSVANQVCESSCLSSSSNLTNSHFSGQEQVCALFHVTPIQPHSSRPPIALHSRFHSSISWQTSSNGPAGSRSVWVAIPKRAQSWSRLSQMAPCSRKIPITLLVPQALHPWNIHSTSYIPWGISPNLQIPTGTLVGYLAPPCFFIFEAHLTRHPLS